MTATQSTQYAPKAGDVFRYVGPRPERDAPSWMGDLVSFRRVTLFGDWEVFTTSGSKTMSPDHLVRR